MDLRNGDCLELMKTLPDKSIDLFICDLPYGETNCKWDNKIDMEEFWKQFKRIRRSPRVACIHFCSTKFGYSLIKSWEKGFKMDLVWAKRNKTGALQSRNRPMRNHEMIYFFHEKAPKYNRDKYHKRIREKIQTINNCEEKKTIPKKDRESMGESSGIYTKDKQTQSKFEPPNPASIVDLYGESSEKRRERYEEFGCGYYEPPNPASILKSEVVFMGKRNHKTEKPLDILEFFLKYWTDEEDVVLDPTMGSGSTGVACKKMNRKFIGFELDPEIFKVAEKRIN